MEKQKFQLTELCLEVTDACAMNCLHCSGSCGPNNTTYLNLNTIRETIQDFANLGGKTLEISGGEPLLHPSIIEIVSLAKQSGLSVVLYSSGNLVGNAGKLPINRDLANKLQKAGLSKIVFNLQGAFPATHERITGVKGSFTNVVTSIIVMKSLGFWIGVHFVPTRINNEELEACHRFCQSLSIDELGILRFVPQGRGLENIEMLEISKRDFEALNGLADKLDKSKSGPRIRIGRPFDFRFLDNPLNVKGDCDAGISRCLISADGTLLPCPAFKSKEKGCIIGNIKYEKLSEMWNNAYAWRNIRRFDYLKLSQPCRDCEHLERCKGGCKAQRLLKYGNLYKGADPCCYKCFMTTMALCPLTSVDRANLIEAQI